MNTDRALFHPDYKPEPYWWEAARPGTRFSTDLPADTEIFVVGSGYSGLSAALELAHRVAIASAERGELALPLPADLDADLTAPSGKA